MQLEAAEVQQRGHVACSRGPDRVWSFIVNRKLAAMQSCPVGDRIATGNHRLCVTDRKLNICFLVDTGANVSVLPARNFKDSKNEFSGYRLFAANNTEIKTYGVRTLELILGLRRFFLCGFL